MDNAILIMDVHGTKLEWYVRNIKKNDIYYYGDSGSRLSLSGTHNSDHDSPYYDRELSFIRKHVKQYIVVE
jgi:hypothetical protein